jgi:3-hydroxybutyryl-CoA dehydrogenase
VDRSSHRIAVVGAGLMGRGIAGTLAAAGHQVMLYDTVPETLDAAMAELMAAQQLPDRSMAAQPATDEHTADRPPGMAVIAAADLASAVTGATFAIEAVVEDLGVKQALFAQLDRLAPDAILATNTSVLPVGAIAARVTRPERVVGTHWWNPPHLIPIVEVVRGAGTSPETLERTEAFLTALGKTPVRVERDIPGFVGNRLQHALWREAIALVADGVCDAATVDLVVRNTIGLRLAAMGPLENADFVGLDLTLAIHDAVLPSLSRQTHPSALLSSLVADGRLGAKSGQGFYPWPAGARTAAAARLAAHVAGQLATRSS